MHIYQRIADIWKKSTVQIQSSTIFVSNSALLRVDDDEVVTTRLNLAGTGGNMSGWCCCASRETSGSLLTLASS